MPINDGIVQSSISNLPYNFAIKRYTSYTTTMSKGESTALSRQRLSSVSKREKNIGLRLSRLGYKPPSTNL